MKAVPALFILFFVSFIAAPIAARAESFVILPEGVGRSEVSAGSPIFSTEQEADFFTDAISVKATAVEKRRPHRRAAPGIVPRAG